MKLSISRLSIAAGAGAAGVAAILLAAPAPAQLREAAEIEAVQQEYRQAWQRGDLDRVMQFWTSDAKAFGPNSVASGAAAIRASLEQSVGLGIYDLRHEEREVFGGGSSAVEITRSVVYDRSGKALLALRYMTLWQKSGGQWRIHREVAVPLDSPQRP